MFEGRRLLIATKHEKEKAIAPILEKALGVHCFLAEHLDTDMFGTFSGEIDRVHDPLTTVKIKCTLAMELVGADLAVASEGSFGPHPTLHFIPADDEIIYFKDNKNGLEVISREISTDTNFKSQEIFHRDQLDNFLESVGFPDHAVIIKDRQNNFKDLVKGIRDKSHLIHEFERFISLYGRVFIETDMRAMFNPTRMRVIQKATHKLVQKLQSLCPQCKMPGFDVVQILAGLPCAECQSPTRSALSYIYQCSSCGFESETIYPQKKTTEDPMYCDWCNP